MDTDDPPPEHMEQELIDRLNTKLQELKALPLGGDGHQEAVAELLPEVLPVLSTENSLGEKKVALSVLINATGSDNKTTTSAVLQAGLLGPLKHVLDKPGDDRTLELGLLVLQNVCECDGHVSQVVEAGIVTTLVHVLAQYTSVKIQKEVLSALINITATEDHHTPDVATPQTVLQIADVLQTATDPEVCTAALTILDNLCSGEEADARVAVVVEIGDGKTLDIITETLDRDLGAEAVQSALDILWSITGCRKGYKSEVIAAGALKKIATVLSRQLETKTECSALSVINNLFSTDHVRDVVTSGVLNYVMSTLTENADPTVKQLVDELFKKVRGISGMSAAKLVPCVMRDMEETSDPEVAAGVVNVLWHISETGEDACTGLIEENYIQQFIRVLEWLKPKARRKTGLCPALMTVHNICKGNAEAKKETVRLGAATCILSLLGIHDDPMVQGCILDVLRELENVIPTSDIWSILPYRLALISTSTDPKLIQFLLRCLWAVAKNDESCRPATGSVPVLQLIAYLLAQNTNKDVILFAVFFIEVLAETPQLRPNIINAGLLPPLSRILSRATPELVQAALAVFALFVSGSDDIKEDVMALDVLPVITSILATWTVEDDNKVFCSCMEFLCNLCADGPYANKYRTEILGTHVLKSLVILLPSLTTDKLVEIAHIYRMLSRLSWGKTDHMTAIAEPEIISCMTRHLASDLPPTTVNEILGVILALAPHLKELLCSSDLLPVLAKLLEKYYQSSKKVWESEEFRQDTMLMKQVVTALNHFASKNPVCVDKILQSSITSAVVILLATDKCEEVHELVLQYVALLSEGGDAAILEITECRTLGHYDNMVPDLMDKKQLSKLKAVLLAVQNITTGPDRCKSAVASTQMLHHVVNVVRRFPNKIALVESCMYILLNMTLGNRDHKQAAKVAGAVMLSREMLDTQYNLDVRAAAKDILQHLGSGKSDCVIL